MREFKFLHYYNTIIWGGGYNVSNGDFDKEFKSKLLHQLSICNLNNVKKLNKNARCTKSVLYMYEKIFFM